MSNLSKHDVLDSAEDAIGRINRYGWARAYNPVLNQQMKKLEAQAAGIARGNTNTTNSRSSAL